MLDYEKPFRPFTKLIPLNSWEQVMYVRPILNKIKVYAPPSIWESARRVWCVALDVIQNIGPYVRTREYCGLTLYFNRGSRIMDVLETEPIFGKEMCLSIEQELRQGGENPVFLDIGANLGLVIAHVVSKMPNVRIFAFEPGPRQRELLKMTVEKNALNERVTIYSDALGEAPGKAIFHTHDPRYIANDGFIDTGRVRGSRAIEVNVTTLDSWWANQHYPNVTVIKIDTEGAELLVLRGATKMLAETSPVVFLEIEPLNLRVYPYTHFDILVFLHENNYELFTLDGVKINKDNFTSSIGKEDTYVARPRVAI